MKTLSNRNVELLTRGASMTGTFIEGLFYVEEDLYSDEIKELEKFCEYIDTEIGGASRYNIQMLFLAFKNPKNKTLVTPATELKKLLLKYKV